MSARGSSDAEALRAMGYEVAERAHTHAERGVLHAYKARGQSLATELIVDASGQLRFTLTRVSEPTRVLTLQDVSRAYRATRERQIITTVMYELQRDDRLADVVRELERAARVE